MPGFRAETSGVRAKLRALREALTNGEARVVENAADAAERAARSTTSWKDSADRRGHVHTRSTIRSTRGGLHGSFVSAGCAAIFLENGTKPHRITARRVARLRFRVNGRWVSKRYVDHPGTKATHFMRDAGLMVRPIFLRNSLATANSAIRRFNGGR